jgi:hypothetical protein
MACPGTRDALDTAPARIWAATPVESDSCDVNTSFWNSEASAAIFAGALAVPIGAYSRLTVADSFFITAMTATKVQPASVLWRQNAISLFFNSASVSGG